MKIKEIFENYRSTGHKFESLMHSAYGGELVKKKSVIKIGKKFLQTILTESMDKFAKENNMILDEVNIDEVRVLPFKWDLEDVNISSKIGQSFNLEGDSVEIVDENELPNGVINIECKWDSSHKDKKQSKTKVYTTMWLESGKIATKSAEGSILSKADKLGINEQDLEQLKIKANNLMKRLIVELNKSYEIKEKTDWYSKFGKQIKHYNVEKLYLAKGTGSLEDNGEVTILFKKLLDLGLKFKFSQWRGYGRIKADVNDFKKSLKNEDSYPENRVKFIIEGEIGIESNIEEVIENNVDFFADSQSTESQELLAASVEEKINNIIKEVNTYYR